MAVYKLPFHFIFKNTFGKKWGYVLCNTKIPKERSDDSMASVKVEKRPFAEEALKQKSRSVFHVWWKHVRGRYKFTGVVGVAISSDGIRMETLRGWWPHIKVVLATLDAVVPDWPEKARQSIEHEKHGPFNVNVQRRQKGWEEYVVRELRNPRMLDMPVVGRCSSTRSACWRSPGNSSTPPSLAYCRRLSPRVTWRTWRVK